MTSYVIAIDVSQDSIQIVPSNAVDPLKFCVLEDLPSDLCNEVAYQQNCSEFEKRKGDDAIECFICSVKPICYKHPLYLISSLKQLEQGVLLQKKRPASDYTWKIVHKRKAYWIDGADPNVSTWERYVNSARVESEQNMFSFQHNGSIFYRVIKPIFPNQELLVWYGDNFGSQLPGVPHKNLQSKVNARDAKRFIF